MRNIEFYSHQGEKTLGCATRMNEDRLVYAHKTFAVIDGATDRLGTDIGGLTSGAYTADYIHKTLTSLAQLPDYSDTNADLLLAGINRAFGEHLKKEHPDVVAHGFEFGPTAVAAFLKFHEDNTYSYGVVGDCFLVVLYTDGNADIVPSEEKPADIEKNRLTHFMKLFHENASKNKKPFDNFMENEEAKAMYMAFRQNLNKNFPVINGDPGMETLMHSGRQNLENVAGFALMTDGMIMPGLSEPEGAHMAAKKIREHGISAYGKSLHAMYNEDAQRNKYPRFKHRDDMTALYLDLKDIQQN